MWTPWLDHASQPHLKQNIQPQRQVILSPQFVGSKSGGQNALFHSQPCFYKAWFCLNKPHSKELLPWICVHLPTVKSSPMYIYYKTIRNPTFENLRKSQETTSEKAIALAVLLSKIVLPKPTMTSMILVNPCHTLVAWETSQWSSYNYVSCTSCTVPIGACQRCQGEANLWDSWSLLFQPAPVFVSSCDTVGIVVCHNVPKPVMKCFVDGGNIKSYRLPVPSHLDCKLGFG